MSHTRQDGLTFLLERNPHPVPASERTRLVQNPGCGRLFTDHMVTIQYSKERGWYDGKIEPHKVLGPTPPRWSCTTGWKFSRA
jgi:branched-chain amino acid aminotransferase